MLMITNIRVYINIFYSKMYTCTLLLTEVRETHLTKIAFSINVYIKDTRVEITVLVRSKV